MNTARSKMACMGASSDAVASRTFRRIARQHAALPRVTPRSRCLSRSGSTWIGQPNEHQFKSTSFFQDFITVVDVGM